MVLLTFGDEQFFWEKGTLIGLYLLDASSTLFPIVMATRNISTYLEEGSKVSG
jgi:hypothetical protein